MSSLPRTAGQGGGDGVGNRERVSREAFWPRYLRRNDSLCAECGYGLSGLDQPRCPECGHLHSLAELSHQANFESAPWYLTAGWGLFVSALLGVPVGFGLIGLGLAMMLSGGIGLGLGCVGAGIAALGMPLWASGWLRASGPRMNAAWGPAKWLAALACWLPTMPLVMGCVILIQSLAAAVK